MVVIKSSRVQTTHKVAVMLAKEIVAVPHATACVIALSGDLGSGKTTFTQGFGRALGIKQRMVSPTFVLLKRYDIVPPRTRKKQTIKNPSHPYLVHIDCYRIKKAHDLVQLGIKDILSDPAAIVLIEWAERVKKLIPNNAIAIRFKHGKIINERIIEIHHGKTVRKKQ